MGLSHSVFCSGRKSANRVQQIGAILLASVGSVGGCEYEEFDNGGADLAVEYESTNTAGDSVKSQESASGRSVLRAEPFGTIKERPQAPESQQTDGYGNSFQGIALGKYASATYMFSSYTKFTCDSRNYGRVRAWSLADRPENYGFGKYLPAAHLTITLEDLNSQLGINADHIGDIDYVHNLGSAYDDLVYLPLEYCSDDNLRPRVAVCRFSGLNRAFDCFAQQRVYDSGMGMPWLTFREGTEAQWQCIFSSRFYDATYVTEYCDWDPTSGLDLKLRGHWSLRPFKGSSSTMTIDRVQGGDHIKLPDGREFLFLQSDNGDGVRGGGIYVFEFFETPGDAPDEFVFSDYIEQYINRDTKQEFEGLALGDIDPVGSGNQAQIHSMLRKPNLVGDDSLRFSHWSVTNSSLFELR
jgi:hypothetical protein